MRAGCHHRPRLREDDIGKGRAPRYGGWSPSVMNTTMTSTTSTSSNAAITTAIHQQSRPYLIGAGSCARRITNQVLVDKLVVLFRDKTSPELELTARFKTTFFGVRIKAGEDSRPVSPSPGSLRLPQK